MLNQLRLLLTQIANNLGDPQKSAVEALNILDQIVTERYGGSVTVERGGAEVEYVVEQSGGRETLAERRKTGKAQPFRCPKAIYDALVQVLVDAERPLPLDELMEAVGKAIGDEPPEFQTRVPLRLWMQVQPPLIVRNRARYRPVEANTFAGTASDLWNSLKK
ncbi:MAG: hypothetical protein QM754_06360 [Tepidisphaeraceae bacterium]